MNQWDNHPDFPVEDWRYEVANDDTRVGYLEWVASKGATAPKDTALRYPKDLIVGDVILGERGGTSHVYEVEASNVMPGMTLATTEHGSLYLDNDLQVQVTS